MSTQGQGLYSQGKVIGLVLIPFQLQPFQERILQ